MTAATSAVTAFAVTQSGQTITPFGIITISPDIRPRTPSGTLTFNGTDADNTLYDVYAQQASGNTYILVAVLHSAAAPSNAILVGYTTNYPSIAQAYWVPLSGGSLDPYVSIAADAKALRLGASQITHADRFGRFGSFGGTAVITLGTGAFTGGLPNTSASAPGDLYGRLRIQTGTAPAASGIIATVTFSKPFVNVPWGVIITPCNAAAIALAGSAVPYVDWVTSVRVDGWDLVAGTTGLAASTNYRWYYYVLSAD